MPRWFDEAMDELVERFNNGEMTRAEYRQAVRDLREDLQGSAEERARRAYDEAMGD